MHAITSNAPTLALTGQPLPLALPAPAPRRPRCELYEYTLPTWAIYALLTGDVTGLETDEIADIEIFETREHARVQADGLTPGHWAWPGEEEPWFAYGSDLRPRQGSTVQSLALVAYDHRNNGSN